MKVLIVSQYYYPEQFQINEIAPELVNRGHEVTVVCGVPNYPKGVVFPGYKTKDERQKIDREYNQKTGVNVIHVEQLARGHNPLTLMFNYWSFVRNSKKAIHELDNDYDVVLGYQLSPITSMYAALEYKKLYGTPILYYTLDIWPVSALGMLKSMMNPFYLVATRISKKIYQGADRILVTSRPFMDYLKKTHSISRTRMGYLPQHAGTDMLEMDLKAVDNGVVDFMFAGNIGKGQQLDVLVNAAAKMGKRPDYKIHMVGDGSMRKNLEKMVKEKGLQDNFLFHGNQRRQDMIKFYRMADVLLITLRGNNEVGLTMPGKMQMYMTTGKTIIGAINGATQEVIKEAKCGGCVNAGDYEELAKLMIYFIEHPKDFEECGKNARKYFKEQFTLEHYMNSLCDELQKLVNKRY